MPIKPLKQLVNRLSLKKQYLEFWEENGYVVLPKLFTNTETRNIRVNRYRFSRHFLA